MNEPKLRFPEFTGNWKQHKISEVGNIVTGSTPKTSISALQVFILVTHLWVPRIRESYSISDSFFFLTKQNKKKATPI